MRIDEGRDQGIVSTIVDVARHIGRKEAVERLFADFLEQATEVKGDARIARLSKAILALRK